MFTRVVHLVFGSKHERDIKKILPQISAINELEAQLQSMSNAQLGAQTERLRGRLAGGETLEEILPEAFATVRETAWRTLGMRHFDVQLIGGIVLHSGKIAEMKTGEGKTLTSTSPIYLNALSGKGVHVVTVNDYLARRDANWMRPIYDFLGISVGVIQHNMDYAERQRAYACDITYGTNNEFGFDYLRDNMVTQRDWRVQRPFNFGIVDEVDSILIDEARTPLIISGPTEENTEQYGNIDRAIRRLLDDAARAPEPPPIEVEPGKEEPHVIRGYYYDVDEKARNVLLTEEGVKRVEEILHVENLFAPDKTELVAHVYQALRAHLIFKNEVDYIVRDGDVIIVDEHTGRTMEGRRYSDGLHQALEAKERVTVKQETQTLASITFQNFFRMYPKLSGMTGTADTEANEFHKIYNLDVVVIPTNVIVQRNDAPDRVYRTEGEKWNAIIGEIRDCNERGQPVLVGTISVEKSEYLSNLLKKAGVAHNVLNAKQHEREAEIVAQAGKPGAVTVATNMAGRGTDIVLGGFPLYSKDLEKLEGVEGPLGEFRDLMLKKNFDGAAQFLPSLPAENDRRSAREIYERSQIWLADHNRVKQSGGLHILGTERHESRRIDNQLRGRAGRQGDPGSSRFYLSLEDHLMRIFGGERIKRIMGWVGMEEGQELEAGMVDRAIARAQKRVESHNFDIRKHLLEYDEVMNRQREFVYLERNKLLDNDQVRDELLHWAEEVLESRIVNFCEGNDSARWDLEGLREWLRGGLAIQLPLDGSEFHSARNAQLALFETIWQECKSRYQAKVEQIGDANFNYVERRIALDVIDARWKEHLYSMDQLREGIWATGFAERNPLVEFKLEGFRLFDQMVESIKEQITEFLFRVQIEGPMTQPADTRRTQGVAQHQALDGFGGDRQRPAPASSAANSPNSAVSGGGASQRRSSRRRRR
ncbi:MAG: preprotein translocase subunit SecA [Leptospirales bacterium]|nr:preprotein translocase subunit SecA [Leptospirales bacterium]